MRRLFWLAMGVTIGALVVRRLSRAAEKLTPGSMASSIAQGLSELADSIRDFSADVREAMTEREGVLRESTGLDGNLGRVPGAVEPTGRHADPGPRPGPGPSPAA